MPDPMELNPLESSAGPSPPDSPSLSEQSFCDDFEGSDIEAQPLRGPQALRDELGISAPPTNKFRSPKFAAHAGSRFTEALRSWRSQVGPKLLAVWNALPRPIKAAVVLIGMFIGFSAIYVIMVYIFVSVLWLSGIMPSEYLPWSQRPSFSDRFSSSRCHWRADKFC